MCKSDTECSRRSYIIDNASICNRDRINMFYTYFHGLKSIGILNKAQPSVGVILNVDERDLEEHREA